MLLGFFHPHTFLKNFVFIDCVDEITVGERGPVKFGSDRGLSPEEISSFLNFESDYSICLLINFTNLEHLDLFHDQLRCINAALEITSTASTEI